MNSWILPALVALVLFGVATFLPKLALGRLKALHLMILQSVFFFISACAVLAINGTVPDFGQEGVLLSVFLGAVGTVAYLTFLFALNRGTVTKVLAVTSLYPAVSAVLAVVFLQETLAARQWAGIGLGLCAIGLAAWEKKA